MVWWLVAPNSIAGQLILVFVMVTMGIWASDVVVGHLDDPDPSILVIDEGVGMWIALLHPEWTWWYFLIAFMLFRFFDILKPWPLSRLQALPGGWGVVMDDVGAGVLSWMVMKGIGYLL